MKHSNEGAIVTGAIFLHGILTFSVHIYHLIGEEQTYDILTGVLPPIVVSVVLVAAAFLVYRSTLPDRYLPRLLVWVFGGAITIALFGTAVMFFLRIHGSEIVNAGFMAFNWAAIGGIGGIFVGYYDVRLQQTQSELAHERDRLAA